MFFAQVTGSAQKGEIIQAVILDPRKIRGTAIEFRRSKVLKEKNWQHTLPRKTTFFVGELETSDRRDRKPKVLSVRFLPSQQFRGVVNDWDPIHMRAIVEYPEILEVHPHHFDSPWLAKGDRIVVEGEPDGLEWNIEDFRLHRRVQTHKLEAGIVSNLCETSGYVRTQLNEEIEFDHHDVLLCDCRDFYPHSLSATGYNFDLKETFKDHERVYFIRAQDPNFERTTIKVFVPKTELELLDPIFEPSYNEANYPTSNRFDASKLNCQENFNQLTYEDASLPSTVRQSLGRTNLKDSLMMKSCPDINAHSAR